MLELAAELGDPVRAGQAVSAIRRSGERLSATAFSRYIIANAKSRVREFLHQTSVTPDLTQQHFVHKFYCETFQNAVCVMCDFCDV